MKVPDNDESYHTGTSDSQGKEWLKR